MFVVCGNVTVFPTLDIRTLGWLSLDNLIKHHTVNSMYQHCVNSDCVVFNSPIEFGSSHSYDTHTQPYFVNNSHCKTRLFDASQKSDFLQSAYSFLICFVL